MEKKTVLYDKHVALNGKIVPFGGYLLPVQYEAGVIKEHMVVRENVGLFDVSHMGEVLIKGKDAAKYMNHLLSNRYDDMAYGQARYTTMCNEDGGIVDDLIGYRVDEDFYMLVPNAANVDKDFAWMQDHVIGDVTLDNISAKVGQIALQGPNAKQVLLKLAKEEDIPTKYYTAKFNVPVMGKNVMISRTGYTGEFGYEIYCAAEDAPELWDALLDAGKEIGILPCGLGARDTLRMEAGMPLYGQEMSDTITPLEAGLNFAVKLKKEEFVGKEALLQKNPPARKRVGLKVTGRGIIREHMPVFIGDKQVGETTSGTHLPYLKGAYAVALLDAEYTEMGTKVEAEVRGKRVEAEVVSPFFYTGTSNENR